MNKDKILAKLDSLPTFSQKLEYLNILFSQAKTEKAEEMILEMIERLKYWG